MFQKQEEKQGDLRAILQQLAEIRNDLKSENKLVSEDCRFRKAGRISPRRCQHRSIIANLQIMNMLSVTHI